MFVFHKKSLPLEEICFRRFLSVGLGQQEKKTFYPLVPECARSLVRPFTQEEEKKCVFLLPKTWDESSLVVLYQPAAQVPWVLSCRSPFLIFRMPPTRDFLRFSTPSLSAGDVYLKPARIPIRFPKFCHWMASTLAILFVAP